MKGSETNLEKLRKIRKTNCPQRLVWQDKIEALKNDWAIEFSRVLYVLTHVPLA